MVRGSRGYNSRGGSGRGTYRSNNRIHPYRMQSNRRPEGFNDNYSGSSSSRYNSSYNNNNEYRNRDKFQSKYSDSRPDGHKRTYRDSSRDRSDDRKRSRQEDSRVNSTYSSSSTPAAYRRTNDSSSRNRGSSPATGSSSYHRASGSGMSSYRGRRDGSDSRRHLSNNDSMGPPKRPIRSSLIVRPRGGGSLSSTRGMRGSTSMRGGIRIIRKESADIRMMRKKLFYAQQKDRARLLKIARLTSSLRRRKVSRRSSSPSPRNRSRGAGGTSSDKKGSDENENNDSDDNVKKEKKKSSKKLKSENKSDDEEDDDGKESADEEEEENGKIKLKDKLISIKKGEEPSSADAGGEVSAPAVEKQNEESVSTPISVKKEGKKTTEDEKKSQDDGEGKKSSSKKIKTTTRNSRSKDKKTDDVEETSPKRKDKKEYHSRHERSSSGKYSNKYIKLTCPHCHLKYVTFKEYYNHLFSRTHKVAMRNISLRQKAHLQRLRQQQRNAQREIEEKSKDEFDELKPKFCLLCRLNYRQPKAKHQLSEHHKTMKKFLMPYCSTCHLAFKSPMLYEAHRCSLEHIKRKARNNESESEESRNETREIDLNKFMTVDSVGEIDDVVDDDGEESDNAIMDGVEEEEDEDGKERLPVGAKFVKKVEAVYCELCRVYSAYNESDEASIRKHCLTRTHMKAFIRHKEDEEEAEVKEEEEEGDVVENGELQTKDDSINDETIDDEKERQNEETTVDHGADGIEESEDKREDKLWEDVDKDLGDLLREVGPDGQDEDDDEEEDESVLNIDIESEKSKIKEIVNGKKEEPTVNNNQKSKDEPVVAKAPEQTIDSAPVVKPKSPRITKEKATPAKTSSNVQSKVTVASKVVSKSSNVKIGKTPSKVPAGTKSVSVKLVKSAAAAKAVAVAKAVEKERTTLEEKFTDN